MGGEYHHVPLQGQGHRPWAKNLLRPQIAKPRHEGSREGGWEHSTTTSTHRRHSVWLHAWTQHHRRHTHCPSVTRKFLCRHSTWPLSIWKGIWSYTQTFHLVGPLQARGRGVAGVAHPEHVWKCQKQSGCCLQPEWRVQCEKGCSSRLLPEPPTVHHGSGSPLPRISYRMSLWKPLRRWHGHHQWPAGWTAREIDLLED